MLCEKCYLEISNANFKKHIKSCDGTLKLTINYYEWHNGINFVCPFCEKHYKKPRSFKSHIWRSHTIDGQKHKPLCPPDKHVSWNRGLTNQTDERVKRNSINAGRATKKQYENGERVPYIPTEEQKLATSKRMSLHNPGGRSKWFEVDGIKIQGTYEKQFAEALENQSIKWRRPSKNDLLEFMVNDKIKRYTPDFFLEDFNLYVEIKGYWWGNDEEKMELVKTAHQDKNLVVLFGKEKLDKICEDITKITQEPLWAW